MIEGETIGSLMGDKLDNVNVCTGLSARVTDGDLFAVCQVIKGKNKVSATIVARNLGWDSARVHEVLDRLYALDILTEMFGDGARYSINETGLDGFLDKYASKPHEEEPVKPAKTVKTRFATPLEGIKPSDKPVKKPRKSATESLDDMLASIAAMPRKRCFEGEERELKIDETYERIEAIVEKLNRGLEALDQVSEKVKFSRTPAVITRVYPEEDGGLGGIRITYRDYALTGEWEPNMTQHWCDEKVERIAKWVNEKLQHAMAVAKRG